MAVPTIVTRTTKGSALSFAEADANFTNLRDATITVSDGSNTSPIPLNGTLQFTAGTGITVAESAGVVTITNTVTDTDTGILNVVEDTTPQLGGNLDGQGNQVQDVEMINYKEDVYALSYAATITPDVANGNVQKVTLTGNLTFSAFSNPEAGQSMTLIIDTNGTGRTLTSTMLFQGGEKTLSTTDTVDIMTVFYDGTSYYASLANNFS